MLLKIFARLVLLLISFQATGQSISSQIRECEQKVYENRYYAYDSILYFAEKQFELASDSGDLIELGKAHLSLALAHYNLGEHHADLINLLEAREIFKSIDNDSLYAYATLEMASLYKEAISSYFQPDSLLHSTVKYYTKHHSDYLLARSYLELGLIFRNRFTSNIGRDSIMFYYDKALKHARLAGNDELIGALYNNIADYYLLKPYKNLDSVISLSENVLKSPINSLKNNAVATLNIFLAYQQLGNPEAINYLTEGYRLSKEVRPVRLFSQASRLLFRHYEKNNQYDSALLYYQQWIETKGTVRTNYNRLLLESKFNESKDARQRNDLLANNLAMQKNLNSAFIFAFFVLVIFIFMIVRNNAVIKSKNEALKKEKEHNARLMKEIHHRVKNNLQMIVALLDLQQSSAKNPDVSVVLNDAGSRVKSIALIHQSLYKGDTDMVTIGFNRYIAELCDSLIYSYKRSEHIDTKLDIDEISMPFDRAVILGLLITELITNVLKHAFDENAGGELLIRIKNDEKGIKMVVQDNGVGLPESFDQKESSFGLDLINSFVQDLGGEIAFSSETGTRVEVIIKDLDTNS